MKTKVRHVYGDKIQDVLRLIENGVSQNQAVQAVAISLGLDPEGLYFALRKHLRRDRTHIVELKPDDAIPDGYERMEKLFSDPKITSHLRGTGVFSREFGVAIKRRSPRDGKGVYYANIHEVIDYVAKKFPHLAPSVIGTSTPQPPQQQKLPEVPKEIEQEAKRSVEDARNRVIALLTRIAVSNDQILDVLEELLGCWVGNAKPK